MNQSDILDMGWSELQNGSRLFGLPFPKNPHNKKSTEPTVSKPKHSSNQTHPGHSSKSGSVWKPILTDRNGKQSSTHHVKMMSFWISEPFLCKVFPSILLHLIKPTSVLRTCLRRKKQLRRITPFPMMSKPTKGSRYLQGTVAWWFGANWNAHHKHNMQQQQQQQRCTSPSAAALLLCIQTSHMRGCVGSGGVARSFMRTKVNSATRPSVQKCANQWWSICTF